MVIAFISGSAAKSEIMTVCSPNRDATARHGGNSIVRAAIETSSSEGRIVNAVAAGAKNNAGLSLQALGRQQLQAGIQARRS